MRKQIKMAVFTALLAVGFTANSQQKTGDIARKDKGNEKGANKTVRVIDNKGTIKYLQSSNGITTLTNESNGVTTTTWQLGGTLDTNTTIELGTSGATDNKFTIDGKEFIFANTELQEDTASADSSTLNTSGWTIIVRDEADGQLKKMLATDLLKVNSVHLEYEVDTDIPGSPDGGASIQTQDVTFFTTTGMTLDFSTKYSKVQVYRNGAKLSANRDYKLDAAGTKLTLVPNTTNANSNQYWQLNDEDFIEVHYTK